MGKFSETDIIRAAKTVIECCEYLVNSKETDDERRRMDSIICPTVFGVNLLLNSLLYGKGEVYPALYTALENFCEGIIPVDRDTGEPMRKVVQEGEGDGTGTA